MQKFENLDKNKKIKINEQRNGKNKNNGKHFIVFNPTKHARTNAHLL